MTPYIQALIAMTGDKLQQRMQKNPTAASDSLLFMGNQHDTVPRRLLQDPLLSPRDKFAWQVIRMQAQDNGSACAIRREIGYLGASLGISMRYTMNR